jgi:hypothetical protein
MRSALILGLVAAAGVVLTARQSAPAAKPPDVSVKAVVAAASKYVDEYAKRLAVIVGDETYIQEQYASETQPPEKTRLMKGEIWVTFLPADRTWIAVHDIAEVDGEKVTDRPELQALLAKSSTQSVAAQVENRNGRYNLGSRPRTMNEPTLALLVLDKRRVPSMEFKRESVDIVNGTTLVTLSFTEREPSLVRDESGKAWVAKGSMVIEAGSGLVRQTRISFARKPTFTELTTTYTFEPRLKLWLPSLFTERYDSEVYGLKEIVKTRATYSNYRQFESFGRIRGGGGNE